MDSWKSLKKLLSFFRKRKNSYKSDTFEKLEDFIIHPTVIFTDSLIGKHSYISPYSVISSTEIGKYCSIGPQVVIGFGDHPTSFLSTSPIFYYDKLIFDKTFATHTNYKHHERVVIKNDVWIGANVYIKNGVTVGNGAIIAAGAVVIKNVPDYSIIGGVPGKVLKYRFSQDNIKKILELSWWNLDDEILQENAECWNKELCDKDLDSLISKLNSHS